MSHRIEPYRHFVAGDSLKLEFEVTDGDGSPIDITASNFKWYLLDREGDASSQALYSSNESGINVDIVDGAQGRVNVEVDADKIVDEGGEVLWQRLVGIEGSNVKKIWSGEFPVNEP